MSWLLDTIYRQKTILFIVSGFIILFGIKSYMDIPKEQFPDIKMPTVYIMVPMPGISPEDADQVIITPIEKKLRSLTNVRSITSQGLSGMGYVVIKFYPNVKTEQATQSVRNKIQEARSDLPKDILEPIIGEVDFSKLPVLGVALINPGDPITLYKDAKLLKKKIENIPGIIQVDAVGMRKEIVDCRINPSKFNQYDVNINQIMQMLDANNSLVSLGNMVNKSDFLVTMSGLLRTEDDVKKLPIAASQYGVIKLGDISTVKRTLEEPYRYGRVNLNPAIILDVSKRAGVNTIEIINKVKSAVNDTKSQLDPQTDIVILRDSSKKMQDDLHDLINNIIFATILVMLVVMIQIGIKQGMIVGISIPLSFYMGIITLKLMGYTVNIVVLFALIMVIGMIVDATIIVLEDADQRMSIGIDPVDAFMQASKRMFIPVMSATVGIIVVFMPLLYWPGLVGEFIRYIPITLIITLSASIIAAMVFIPVIGGTFCKKYGYKDTINPDSIFFKIKTKVDDLMDAYEEKLKIIIEKPKVIPKALAITFVITIFAYSFLGKGTEFFPKVEPDSITVNLSSASNMSPEQKLEITKKVESIIWKYKKDIRSIYSNVNPEVRDVEDKGDTVASLTIEYEDWDKRRKSAKIVQDLRNDLASIEGIEVKILETKQGPSDSKKDIVIYASYEKKDGLNQAVESLVSFFKSDSDYVDVSDTRATERVEFDMSFNKEVGIKHGVTVSQVGAVMRMFTNGLIIGKMTFEDGDERTDIVLNYPKSSRNTDAIRDVSILNSNGERISASHLITVKPKKEVSRINKINYNKTIVISANVTDGVNVNQKVNQVEKWIKKNKFKNVNLSVAGDKDDQIETANFLKNAFIVAILIKIMILIAQFNSVYYTLVVMSAVIFSIIGVLWGLIISGKSFCIVMSGLGIISLAGVVVSNNIILIDTYQKLILEGMELKKAIVTACRKRIRPILMTSATAIIGLLPMIFNVNIDFINLKILFNSPSGQFWEHLSITIASGLTLTTFLTLFFTPCVLAIYTPEWHGKKNKNDKNGQN